MVSGKQADKEFHLHNSFTYWISRLASLMQEHFNESLQQHDVTWPQWMVLNVLYHRLATTPAQVAANIGIDRSAITRLVDRLEKKGLVQRQHDGLDRRSIRLLLTERGSRLIHTLNDSANAHQRRFLEHLPSTEYRGLKGNIQKMLRAGGLDTTTLWRRI
ncbi:MarR family transcriptional regulator [Exilibacterium tricleocarpae]|uniref:MarR family transcriptional regulator n=1 Tax=Exilibacterium tricleocarpae TaxID=2591008 RepID=A0A545TVN4_9GAMM|nr:MarR family transcriptional regulator [Exilibacterium tricleocarpae]TQV81287.1 MarR family transcriptional regulator [Exilibacterium tricleocarpae]